MTRRDVVLLDAGGTLFTERESRDETYARVIASAGCDVRAPDVARLRRSVHDALRAEQPDRLPYTSDWFHEHLRRLLAALRCPADPEPLRRALADHFSRPENFVVHADSLPAIEELLARGARLGLVSNWSEQLPALLRSLGLAPYFEVVAVSAVVGHTKPEAALFAWALDRLGARPGQALHVGDDAINDLAGARRAGLAALLLDRAGRTPVSNEVIRSLEEVPGRLEA